MEKTKPAFETRLANIRLAVWENQTSDGLRRWYSAAPTRRYFPDAGSKEAKYTATFNGVAELVLLREAINQAIVWLSSREQQSEQDDEQ